MKSYLKPIATAVIVAMTVLFAYQTWWLARMYRSEVLKTENAVIAALRTCDFNEMMYRLQRVGEEQAAEDLREILLSVRYLERMAVFQLRLLHRDIGEL